MRNSLIILFSLCFTIIATSCIDDSKKTIKTTDKQANISENIVQVLKHPLVFEDLGLKILYFSSQEIKPDVFELKIALEVNENIEKFSKNHFFFIHGFDYNNEDFINMDTKSVRKESNTLIFKRILKSNIYDFQEIRFGLVKRTKKERYFTRTIKNPSIKK